jgi:hypothetical protein
MKAAGADQTAQNANNIWPGGTSPANYNVPAAGYALAGDTVQYTPNPTFSGAITATVPSMDKLPDPPCSGCVYKVLGAQRPPSSPTM